MDDQNRSSFRLALVLILLPVALIALMGVRGCGNAAVDTVSGGYNWMFPPDPTEDELLDRREAEIERNARALALDARELDNLEAHVKNTRRMTRLEVQDRAAHEERGLWRLFGIPPSNCPSECNVVNNDCAKECCGDSSPMIFIGNDAIDKLLDLIHPDDDSDANANESDSDEWAAPICPEQPACGLEGEFSFGYDSSSLETAHTELVACIMQSYGEELKSGRRLLLLDGFASSKGPKFYNDALSSRRVETIRKAFDDAGLNGYGIIGLAHGENDVPVDVGGRYRRCAQPGRSLPHSVAAADDPVVEGARTFERRTEFPQAS